jgi:hypothetical protein
VGAREGPHGILCSGLLDGRGDCQRMAPLLHKNTPFFYVVASPFGRVQRAVGGL